MISLIFGWNHDLTLRSVRKFRFKLLCCEKFRVDFLKNDKYRVELANKIYVFRLLDQWFLLINSDRLMYEFWMIQAFVFLKHKKKICSNNFIKYEFTFKLMYSVWFSGCSRKFWIFIRFKLFDYTFLKGRRIFCEEIVKSKRSGYFIDCKIMLSLNSYWSSP